MLTGRKLFGEQETASEIIAAVLTREPDLHALTARTPLSIRYLLTRCLVKEPKNRLRDIGDARLALQTAIDGTDLAIADTAQAQPRKSRTLAALLVAATSGVVLGTGLMWFLRPSPVKRVIKLEVPTENLRAERVRHPLISPDGTESPGARKSRPRDPQPRRNERSPGFGIDRRSLSLLVTRQSKCCLCRGWTNPESLASGRRPEPGSLTTGRCRGLWRNCLDAKWSLSCRGRRQQWNLAGVGPRWRIQRDPRN